MAFEIPGRGFVFWPVGNGDSTTIVVDSETWLQIDLNHLEKSHIEDDARCAVIDALIDRLPKVNGHSYLAAFALTHPDQDHCRGFAELLTNVEIGELWFTPRVFCEFEQDLCDDAQDFKKEAKRRVKATIAANGDPGIGNRVRVFGYSELLEEEDFRNFPDDRLTVPGNEVTIIDGKNVSDQFRAFVHAPFKDDSAGERNDTCLGLQVTLYEESQKLSALLLGDLSYPEIHRIFDVSRTEDLLWNVLLAPHHCSKAVMYWKDDGDSEEKLKKHIIDEMDKFSLEPNRVVSSSNPVPSTNKLGDNPPHSKAKAQYEMITESFLCTADQDEPIVAKIENKTIILNGVPTVAMSAGAAAGAAQGSSKPPENAHTYGRRS